MRQILNISLSKEMAENIRNDAKDEGFSSISEFIRAAVRIYLRELAVRRIKKGQKEFAKGKTRTVHSFTEFRKFR
ncbi:MAG: ribbon-helix-helix domain-containing protein [Patescibacteria group bacterium]